MSSKISAASKTVATRSNKNILENNHQLPTTGLSSGGLVSYDNCNTLIEVIVKAKGHKRTSTMVSSSPTGHKAVEEKKRPGSSSDSHQSWGRVLREQNKTVMKQGLQRLMTRTPGSKSSKHGCEIKETKKQSLNHQKSDYKHLDEIPIKQPASQKRIEEHIKSIPHIANPSSTSIPSTVESIIVYDKGVQCDGLFDYSDDRFSVFNPVRTLSFLIKELEHLVKDDKANKILTDMEQALLRVAVEPSKPVVVVSTTTQLEETTRQMNSMCEALRDERDSLQRQVHKQVLLLNEARERQLDLETTIKSLKQELEEKIKTVQAKDKTITELTEEIKGYKFSQKVVAELRMNLAEQTELARQRHLEVQYLTLEKDKLSVLSTYKDSLLNELRNAIKELQNHIADQLSGLKDIYVHEESSNPQISLVHRGLACSSPTSTSSHNSNIHISWRDISDISLSTADHDPTQKRNVQNFLHKADKISAFSETQIENLEKKRTKNIKESSTKDSANLDFISLPGGESSLTLLPYKDFGCTEMSKSVNRGMGDVVTSSNKRSDNLSNFKSTNKMPSSENLHLSLEKAYEKETDGKDSPRNKKFLEPSKKQSFGKKSIVIEDTVNILKDNSPHNLIGSTITEQFQNIFQDIRIQSRMPINVPSPPRSYPHPEWSDSTLPSISTASDINVIHPNDT
ncbi:PREDICTED: uncharacterized protein LOC108556027 [Eufriesea mexicana]|uniref:uncharacterized protein LOC108556027 n=1 Tax=Eufriesea mexicana TaxID=516756 RepID=UPI00083BEE72|nr:PREDICTED: uncharacterized protein LOC108556027 [Eufriesea mexicana]